MRRLLFWHPIWGRLGGETIATGDADRVAALALVAKQRVTGLPLVVRRRVTALAAVAVDRVTALEIIDNG